MNSITWRKGRSCSADVDVSMAALAEHLAAFNDGLLAENARALVELHDVQKDRIQIFIMRNDCRGERNGSFFLPVSFYKILDGSRAYQRMIAEQYNNLFMMLRLKL